jgi:hypothetical protein
MDIDNGGASAPAEPIDARIDDAPASPPNPISTESNSEPEHVSIDDAIERASAKVEGKDRSDDQAKDQPKPVKSEQPRDNGRFAAKEPAKEAVTKDAPAKDTAPKPADPAPKAGDGVEKAAAGDKSPEGDPAQKPSATVHAAPARFSTDAKAAWDTAPEPVRAEVTRMERELTAGVEKYRQRAERDSSIDEFHELAAKTGTDVKSALTKYVNMEQLLRTNPLKGLEAVCDNIGVSLKEVAAVVMGQTPDQAASQNDATIRDLRGTIAQLEQRLAGVSQRFQQQDDAALHDLIGGWAADKPLFEILAPHIAAELKQNNHPATTAGLDAAYSSVLARHPELAALGKPPGAKPGAKESAEASAAAAAALEAQTLKGTKSINGAPAPGSDPTAKKRSKSIDEAIDRAFEAAG